jgi:hypothetical protein
MALMDAQLSILMTTARALDSERRGLFLERVGAMLKLRGRFADGDVGEIADLALCGLVQQAETVA